MLEALTTPRHIILATVLAIGVALPVVYATEVTADFKVAITDVERKITAIDKVVKRHTYELRDATARAPSDATRFLYRLTGKGGEVFYFEGPADPGGIDINQVAVELFMKKNRKFVSYDSAWAEVQGSGRTYLTRISGSRERKPCAISSQDRAACYRKSGTIAFFVARANGTSDDTSLTGR